jgi:Trehalose synthase, N-terminal domain
VNFNSTYYGGGVAEMLSSLTLLMNAAGIRAEWRVLQGDTRFFLDQKKFHNALQGGEINLSEMKTQVFEQVIYENAVRNRIDHDFVLIHDPQPLPLIVQLLQDDDLRRRLGTQAHRTVQERFLLTRYFEQYLDLFGSFETVFRLRSDRYSD